MAKDNYCIYCGFKLFPEDHFCPHCGKKLDEAEKPKSQSKYGPSKVVDGVDLSSVNKVNNAKRNSSLNYTGPTTVRTTTPDYTYYKKQVKDLKETYETKESKVIELLEKKFPNGQMSYGRFRAEVDNCRVTFYREAEAAESMIELSDEYSDKIATALKEKIKTLKSIIAKMNDLQSELIISISNGEEDSTKEIDNLIKEMNELIDSVKDYD